MKTNDESQVNDARRREKLRDVQLLSDLKAVMDTPQGRRTMYWVIFGLAAAESASFNSSGSLTYFNEGRRDVGLTLMNHLQNSLPELYLQMLGEAITKAKETPRRA